MCKVTIRKFTINDIPAKINWINNSENNKFLHYNLPLEYDKTVEWYNKIKDNDERYDAVIEADDEAVGLIGLLSIKNKENSAEYYISMGSVAHKGKGIAYKASKILLEYAFNSLKLDKVYLYTEKENRIAQKLFSKIGFCQVKLIEKDIFFDGTYRDRYYYVLTKERFLEHSYITPICRMGVINGNNVYIKRDDLIPFSFGGNKARKANLFFNQIDNGDFDCVVTYGSAHSNHCRVVSNMCATRGIPCTIISPIEATVDTNNLKFMRLFGAQIVSVYVDKVHDTIEKTINNLIKMGKKPFFIPGGGHGNIGTQAYVECYEEIASFEKETGIWFDYVFLASGTGTTQAGLVCGQIINKHEKKIIGISVARKNPRGRDVVIESVNEYLSNNYGAVSQSEVEEKVVFLDEYISDGYSKSNAMIEDTIKNNMINFGIPMDITYTGKAYTGMTQYIDDQRITGKNIIFIHTGGTPLFFDDFRSFI